MLTSRLISAARPLLRPLRLSPALVRPSSRARDEVYRELVEPDQEMTDLVDRYCFVPSMKQQVLVIQPFIRFGDKAKLDTGRKTSSVIESVLLSKKHE